MQPGSRERNRLAAMDRARRTAFALMTERGFDEVTVEEIAKSAGVSPSTLYRYFGTKEALVLSSSRVGSLLERLCDDDSDRGWVQAFQRAAAKAWTADGTARVELGLVIANESLLHAWERQLLDARDDIADSFAARRGKARSAKDEVRAAAAIAVFSSALLRWHAEEDDDGWKSLARLMKKSFRAVTAD